VLDALLVFPFIALLSVCHHGSRWAKAEVRVGSGRADALHCTTATGICDHLACQRMYQDEWSPIDMRMLSNALV
jgi:hypothetical protein